MAIRPSTATRNAQANGVTATADAGAGAAVMEIRTLAQPANGDAADVGTLLATFTLADPSFGAAANGVITLAGTPIATTGVAAGDAGHARIKDSAGNNVTDASVSASGGGGDVIVDNVTIAVDQNLSLVSGTITAPAG